MAVTRVAMTIAGSDSSGGAGIAADLKTFAGRGVWGTAAITAVTAQNTLGVQATFVLPADIVAAQIRVVASDLGLHAVKTGMLGSADIVRAVAETIRALGPVPLVVDPVLLSGQGDRLLDTDALSVLREDLLPLATVITPNVPEAAALTGTEISDRAGMEAAARSLADLGPHMVVIKGGHLADSDRSPDLVYAGSTARWLDGPRLSTVHTHGTGCVMSAAICAELAKGTAPFRAVVIGKDTVTRAIEAGVGRRLGQGIGPVAPA